MTQQSKTHWKQLINPDYIGAYALPDGEDLTVTIDYVQSEVITGSGGKKEECTVAHLVDHKPLILNVTNSKSIHKLYGPYIEDWRGKKITLYASTTKMAGEIVECLRIRPSVAEPTKQNISDKRLESAIESIRKGEFTLEKLQKNFFLTPSQEKRISDALELEHD